MASVFSRAVHVGHGSGGGLQLGVVQRTVKKGLQRRLQWFSTDERVAHQPELRDSNHHARQRCHG